MLTLKPLLEFDDADMAKTRDSPVIIQDAEGARETTSHFNDNVGQKKTKLLDHMKAVKDTFLASAKVEVQKFIPFTSAL